MQSSSKLADSIQQAGLVGAQLARTPLPFSIAGADQFASPVYSFHQLSCPESAYVVDKQEQERSERAIEHAAQAHRQRKESVARGIRDRGDSAQGEQQGFSPHDQRNFQPQRKLAVSTGSHTSSRHENFTITSLGPTPESRLSRPHADGLVDDLRKAIVRAEAEAAAANASQRRTELALQQHEKQVKQELEGFRSKIAQASAELADSKAAQVDLGKKLSHEQEEVKRSNTHLKQVSTALQAAKANIKQHKHRERTLMLHNKSLQAELLSANRDLEAVRAHVTAVKATITTALPEHPIVDIPARDATCDIERSLASPSPFHCEVPRTGGCVSSTLGASLDERSNLDGSAALDMTSPLLSSQQGMQDHGQARAAALQPHAPNGHRRSASDTDCGSSARSQLSIDAYDSIQDRVIATSIQQEYPLEGFADSEPARSAEKVDALDSSEACDRVVKLWEAARAACVAAEVAERECVPRLAAHVTFLTAHVAQIFHKRRSSGSHGRSLAVTAAENEETPAVHALNHMNDRLAAENAQLTSELACVRALQLTACTVCKQNRQTTGLEGIAAAADLADVNQATPVSSSLIPTHVEVQIHRLQGQADIAEGQTWQGLPAALGGGRWQKLLRDTMFIAQVVAGFAADTPPGNPPSDYEALLGEGLEAFTEEQVTTDTEGAGDTNSQERLPTCGNAAVMIDAVTRDVTGTGMHGAAVPEACRQDQQRSLPNSAVGGDTFLVWLEEAAAALVCLHSTARTMQANLAQSLAAEVECQSKVEELSRQNEDAQRQMQLMTARLHTAERQARRASSGVPAAALRAAARSSSSTTDTQRSTQDAEAHTRVAQDRRPRTSAGALEPHAMAPPRVEAPVKDREGYAHEFQAGQLARLQNALDASRRDGERREAALKQAVAARSRAEVDLAEAREQLRNGDERCTVLRQQLAKACSSLEAAGLPLPAKAPVDTRASLVREQQHHIRELEKAAAELKELVAASKSETATVRQQMARNTKMADKKMQVASDAARAHADSLAKELEDAENQILIIQAECKQAKEQTEVVRCELYKVQQLHTAAHEIIQALQQKEAAKKSRMVAEHAFSVSYNPHQ